MAAPEPAATQGESQGESHGELPPVGLLEGMATMRSVRRYRDEPFPDHDLATILWHASRAPSGSNRQPFRFLVLRDGQRAVRAKALLGETFRRGWTRKDAAEGLGRGSDVDPNSAKARAAATMQHFVDHVEQIPVIVLVCLVRYRDPNPYEGASLYPACQNLLLAARALGYGGALTMWHLGVEGELRELLEIPTEVALSACITLGRPVGHHGPVRRRPLDQLVFEDHWDAAPDWAQDPPGTATSSWRPART